MKSLPTADSSPDVVLDWLHEQGWSICHAAEDGRWIVKASRGNQHIKSTGNSLEEAWLYATEEARMQDAVYCTSEPGHN